ARGGGLARGCGAAVPGVEPPGRLLLGELLVVREERDLPAGLVDRELSVLALAGAQRRGRAVRRLQHVDAIGVALLGGARIDETGAILREQVADDVLDPALLARGQVAQHERMPVLALVLRRGAGIGRLSSRLPRATGRPGGIRCGVRIRLARELIG